MRRATSILVLMIVGTVPSARAEERKDREGFPLPDEAVARVGSARLRHELGLNTLVYSPDGSKLLSAGYKSLRLWDARTGKPLWSVPVGTGQCTFSADGDAIVVCGNNNCRWLDIHTGLEVRRCALELPKAVEWLILSSRGDVVVAVDATRDREFTVCDLPSGKRRFCKTVEGARLRFPALSRDGKTLAVWGYDRDRDDGSWIKVFDTATAKLLVEIDCKRETITSLLFSPDGTRLIAPGHKAVRVWKVPIGELLHRIDRPGVDLEGPKTVTDRNVILAGSLASEAVAVELATGKEARRFLMYRGANTVSVAPDGKTLAVGKWDGAILQWEFGTAKALPASADPPRGVEGVDFSGDGKLVWTRRAEGHVATDWTTGKEVRRLSFPRLEGDEELIASPDRSLAATYKPGELWVLHDLAAGKILRRLDGARSFTDVTAFSPDGKAFYAVESPVVRPDPQVLSEGPVRGWGLADGKELPPFDKEQWRWILSLVVSPDGRWLAARREGGGARKPHWILIWNRSDHSELRRLALAGSQESKCLAFTQDGTRLAGWRWGEPTGHGDEVGVVLVIWDVQSGKEKVTFDGLRWSPSALAFSHDGRMFASATGDGELRVWEVATGKLRHAFVGHESRIEWIAFAPDDRLLAAASADAPVLVWDVTGTHVKPAAATGFGRDDEERLWNSLADGAAAAAFKAMRQLMARPHAASVLLAGRLKPVPSVSEKGVQQLLRDLDSDEFETRRKAVAELGKVAGQVEPLLCAALKESASMETKRCIEEILVGLRRPTPERQRDIRAIEVLERIGTKEAMKLLEEIASGSKAARLTLEAKAALERLKKPL